MAEANRETEKVARGWQIEESDEAGLEKWAKNLCKGLSVDWMADALQVDSTIDAVVDKITESISNPDLRKRIEEICKSEILKTSQEEEVESQDGGGSD
jgi:hypothetical protein